jgi:hypothetical protein
MALKDQFKVDIAAAEGGVWFEYVANSDGTVPAFKLARTSKQNKKYIAAMRKFSENFADDSGVADFTRASEAELDKWMLDIFADTVILDWRNFQPEDDGVAVPFSKDAVRQILGSAEWVDLYNDLTGKAKRVASFNQKKLEAQAKN